MLCSFRQIYVFLFFITYSTTVIHMIDAQRLFGDDCDENSHCQSNFCLSICGKPDKICALTKNFYQKNFLKVPECLKLSNSFNDEKKEPSKKTKMDKIKTTIVDENEKGKGFGDQCKSNNQCRSQHCIHVCYQTTLACARPRKYYFVKGLPIPSCLDTIENKSYISEAKNKLSSQLNNDKGSEEKSTEEKDLIRGRPLSKKCTDNSQCQSQNCNLVCDSSEKVCDKPHSLYTDQGDYIPKCVDQTKMKSVVSKRRKVKKILHSLRASQEK